jgi:hypothetical protein
MANGKVGFSERSEPLKRRNHMKLAFSRAFIGDFLDNFRQGNGVDLGAVSWIPLSMITSC